MIKLLRFRRLLSFSALEIPTVDVNHMQTVATEEAHQHGLSCAKKSEKQNGIVLESPWKTEGKPTVKNNLSCYRII